MSANNTNDSVSPAEDAEQARRIREFIDELQLPSEDELEYISDHSGLSMV